MGRDEFFLLMPAIIYGVAIVDLLKIFYHKKTYWEIFAWGIIYMMYIIIIWLELWAKLDVVSANKWFFILTIIKAIVLARIAAILTPEERHEDTKKYFLSIRVPFFILLTVLVVFNLVLQEFFYNDYRPWYLRISIFAFALSSVFINKIWIRVATLIVVFSVLVRIIITL